MSPANTARKLPGLSLAVFLIAFVPLVSSPALTAQSGEEVLRTAVERYEERMQGIKNYTVVQEVMAFESTTYFERTEVDGHAVFVPRSETGSQAARRAPGNPYSDFLELAESAERMGTEDVDGETCHVIAVTDFEGVDFWRPSGGDAAGNLRPERITFFVDTDDYLVRRIRMNGAQTVQGETNQVTLTADLEDYREVEGMTHPFVTEVSVEGLQGSMSEEQQAEMRQSLEEMRAQMEEMSEQQRRMMERMMGGQLGQMERMLAV